ncbi:hypothetical protein PBY51_010210 [Eleginops maclovinus]|uniref:RING-type domain-containing protein n=1 Tax=Eleginops maclovinus TaxID=56733 RepID=A0AAN8AJ99_ELEMC|nr:hypothetical protein PBY51_010210 [Eleginops maclovinus]
MDTYVLFLREKRVTVRPEDLKTEKIAVIFQVQKDTIYLTDDHNIAIFPEENGHFISVDLVDRGHYELGQLGKRRRLSRREDTGLQDVVAEIEEVIEAAQGLKEVTKSIKEVTEGTGKATLLCLQEGEVNALKTVFGCLVCPGPVEKPIFSSCCRSIIGCRSCIQQWEHSHDYCPKCRCQDRETNEVAGLDEALAVLRKLF